MARWYAPVLVLGVGCLLGVAVFGCCPPPRTC
jgi:hypothetical protein